MIGRIRRGGLIAGVDPALLLLRVDVALRRGIVQADERAGSDDIRHFFFGRPRGRHGDDEREIFERSFDLVDKCPRDPLFVCLRLQILLGAGDRAFKLVCDTRNAVERVVEVGFIDDADRADRVGHQIESRLRACVIAFERYVDDGVQVLLKDGSVERGKACARVRHRRRRDGKRAHLGVFLQKIVRLLRIRRNALI